MPNYLFYIINGEKKERKTFSVGSRNGNYVKWTRADPHEHLRYQRCVTIPKERKERTFDSGIFLDDSFLLLPIKRTVSTTMNQESEVISK